MKKISQYFSCNKTFLKLSTTLLASCTFFSFVGSAKAVDLDVSKKPENIPTLDYLKNTNQQIPQINQGAITSPNSGYKIEQGTASDHTFEYKSQDANGNITTSYYKIVPMKASGDININGATGHITWDAVDASGENTIDVILPNNVVKHFKYTYNKPENYTTSSTRQGALSASNINNVLYQNIIAANDGGVFDNTKNNSSSIIKSDFVNNSVNHMASDSAKYMYGGAIKNEPTVTVVQIQSSNIGGIEGDFVNNGINVVINGNYVGSGQGGAIYNYTSSKATKVSSIGNITGDFVGNRVNIVTADNLNSDLIPEGTIPSSIIPSTIATNFGKGVAQGGAIYNSSYSASQVSEIGDIVGNFIGNGVLVLGQRKASGYYVTVNAEAMGGAIYNTGSIANIAGDFIANAAIDVNNAGDAYGGAIYNTGTFKDIKGNFINNTATGNWGYGGAIYNDTNGVFGNIEGSFYNNVSSNFGGAIYNRGTIGDITGDFYENASYYTSAIENSGTIGNITGNFINNVSGGYGRAIDNSGTMGNVTGSFIGNVGGAIRSTGAIGNITGDFIENIAETGGAILINNDDAIDITGDFIQNKAQDSAAICNNGALNNVTGNFIGNTTLLNGALTNRGDISKITGDFIQNKSHLFASSVQNTGNIDTISSDFNSNEGGVLGGSIYNTGTIENIIGNHIGNKTNGDFATLYYTYVYGGTKEDVEEYRQQLKDTLATLSPDDPDYKRGVYELSALDAQLKIAETMQPSFGGSILNMKFGFLPDGATYEGDPNIKNIQGDFIGNKADGNISYGGAIANISWGGKLNGLFFLEGGEDASAQSINTTIDNIQGDFISNQAASGGAIANFSFNDEAISPLFAIVGNSFFPGGEYGELAAYLDLLNLKVQDNLKIGNIQGNFINNIAQVGDLSDFYQSFDLLYKASESYANVFVDQLEGMGEILALPENPSWQDIIDSIDNFIANGKPDDVTQEEWQEAMEQSELALIKAIAKNQMSIDVVEGAIKDSLAKGGAIYNENGEIETITNSSFISNRAVSKTADVEAKGGAIYTNKDLKIVADNYTSIFDGNKIEDTKRGTRPEAIYVQEAQLTLETKNNGKFLFNDEINGDKYKLNIKGDNTGVITLNNNVSNAEISMNGTTVNVSSSEYLNNNNSLNMQNGTLNIAHLGVSPVHFNEIALSGGDINLNRVDVDLQAKEMGRITADSYSNISPDVKINVSSFNLLSDAKDQQTEILFADKELMNNVSSNVSELPDSGQDIIAYTPKYRYEVDYNTTDEGGFFTFNRGGANANSFDAFNPAVLAGPVAAQSGALSVASQTTNYAFQNSDNFMNIPYLERLSIKNANRYAISENDGVFSPLLSKNDSSSFWVKPYTIFENVPLKHGPKVQNIVYGTLAGYDSEFTSLKHGWDRVLSGYIGYNGATQQFSGVDATQNGGLLGGTSTFYKGNFFNATTLQAGANVGLNQTMYGKESVTMLLAGVGNKMGYNIEFKDGKVILQPNLIMSYTFVNTFDYTNAAGVRIKADPLHALQISPGVKLIGNTANGWQPYIGVNMVWNLMDKTQATADGVRLPDMSIKPYVQYGIGIQKRFQDRCMAFGQAMVQNGGRNGIALNAGFRWAVGKEHKERVQNKANKMANKKP